MGAAFLLGGMAAPTGATAKLLTMLCWVSVVAQIEVLQRLALTKSLCQSYSKSPETKNRSELQLFCDWQLLRAPQSRIAAQKRRQFAVRRPLFRFAGTGKGSQSQKSCRDAEIFVFTMGGLPQRVDIAMGGSPQRGKSRRCAYSRRQRGRQRLGPLIGRNGPWALPDWVGRQPVCRGVCCGLDGAAAPRS